MEDTIRSVLNQNYSNIEHIVMDGGSTDNSLQILAEYEKRYNLRWISEPDKGQADAVNKGFEMAQGEIVGWLNSDDMFFDVNTISCVVQEFQKHKEADILYGHAVKINAENRLMRIKHIPPFNYNRLTRLCYIVQPSVFFRRRVIEQEKLDPSFQYGMDYEYWLRLGKRFTWKRIDRILSVDRNHKQRKIIASVDKSKAEERHIRRQHGSGGPVSYLLQVFDKILYRWWRFTGLLMLGTIRRNYQYAFALKFDKPLHIVFHQLFRKDRKLL